jgi:hypothetical protein
MTSSNVVSLGGMSNKIECSSDSSTTLGGSSNTISNSKRTSILGGFSNIISNNTYQGSIVGGQSNTICSYSDNSIILGGNNSFIGRSGASSFGFNQRSSIMGGGSNCILTCSCNSTISGGLTNVISSSSSNSSIIGGQSNRVGTQSSNSSIVGGRCNSIFSSNSSVIIGGTGLSLTSENNMVYVPQIKIATVSNDNSLSKVLVWDGDDSKTVKYRDVTSISGGVTIDATEVAFGNVSGLTSSNSFTFNNSVVNVPELSMVTASNDDSLDKILVYDDSDTKKVKYRNVTSLPIIQIANLDFGAASKVNIVNSPYSIGDLNGLDGDCFIYGGIAELTIEDLDGTTGNAVIRNSTGKIILQATSIDSTGKFTLVPTGGPVLVQGNENLTIGVTGGSFTSYNLQNTAFNYLRIYYIYDPIGTIE